MPAVRAATSQTDEAAGQVTFDMANLRQSTTGLPFVVFISQKGGARHDVRVKIAPGPRVSLGQMSTYALRPFRHLDGPTLADEALLAAWVTKNMDVLTRSWDGDIEYTEDAIEKLQPV